MRIGLHAPTRAFAILLAAGLALAACDQDPSASSLSSDPASDPVSLDHPGDSLAQGAPEDGDLPSIALPEDLEARDAVVHLGVFGASHDGRFFADHPATVNLGVRVGDELGADVAIVGLVKTDADNPAQTPTGPGSTCALGTFDLETPRAGVEPGQVLSLSGTFVVPSDCVLDPEQTLRPWVWLVNYDEIAAEGLLEDTTVCTGDSCEGAPSHEQVFVEDGEDLPNRLEDANMVVFDEAHLLSPRNQICRTAEGEAGCVLELRVDPSPGLDVAMDRVENVSSVAVNWSLLEQPEDAEAWVAPLFAVSTNVTLYGTAPNELTIDPVTGAVDMDPTTELPAPLDISYSLCPTELGDACEGAAWQALDVEGASPTGEMQNAAAATVEELAAHSARTLMHNLYPSAAALDAISPGGSWAEETHFTLRACAETHAGFDEMGLDVDATANNCTLTDLVVVAPPEDYSDSLNKVWGGRSDKTGGGWLIKLDFTTGHFDTIDISGLHTDTWLKTVLTALGDVVNIKVIDIVFDGDAFVAILHSGLNYHFIFLDKTYATYYNRLDTYQDPNVGKGKACGGNADCDSPNFPICTNYNSFGVGKCGRPCSDPSICRYGESCVGGECQFVGPAHLTYNWEHIVEKEWSKSFCQTVFCIWLVIIVVCVDFCYGGSAGYGYGVRISAAHLCGEDQKDDVCVEGKCYIGAKYCSPEDPASCGTCGSNAECQCDAANTKLPPIDISAGPYGNLKAPLRRMGYLEGTMYGIGSIFLEISAYAFALIAKAGITAHLDLIKVKAPKFTGELIWATQALGEFLAYRIMVGLKITVELNFLSGYIIAWAKLLLPYFCWKTITIPWLCCSKWSCSFCSKQIKIPWLCFKWEEIWRATLAEWAGIYTEPTLWQQNLIDESVVITPPGGE